jgi:hypothetical protein
MRTSILGVIVCAAVGSFAFFSVASPAEAASVEISASGEWGPGTPTVLPWSTRNASWSFSFDLPNPISRNPTTQVTNFSYSLNGTEIIDKSLFASLKVEFFTADFAGMFDLDFADGDVVSLYGADIGSSLTIIPGRHTGVFAGMQMLPETSEGGIVNVSTLGAGATGFGADPDPVSPLGVTRFGAVPESSTWVMMTLGLAGLAFAGYRASRNRAMVA